jgi:glycerol-3-phosphate acyltransferase PlsY
MTVDWIAAIISYLLGSIPFGYLLVLLFRKQDIRQTGSGNIGATNVLRSGSRWLGILTLLLDLGKGFVAVVIARHLATGSHAIDTASIGALFAVVGHVFPIWLRGKGGKGVATALGVFLALAPLAALSSVAVFIVTTWITRYVSLASILAATSFPVWVWLAARVLGVHYGHGPIFVASIFLVPAMILIKHKKNAQRLLHGTEYRFGNKDAEKESSIV